MKNILVENALRWMLAVWMLLATQVTSSTIEHSHSGGNLSHQHGSSDCTPSHASVPEIFHDDHAYDMSLSAVDIHCHGYFVLLGAISYKPKQSEPSGSHEKSSSGGETIVAIPAAQGVRTLSKSLTVDHSGLASLAVFSTVCICESRQREILCSGVAPAAPLCDRARHERSGVQLA